MGGQVDVFDAVTCGRSRSSPAASGAGHHRPDPLGVLPILPTVSEAGLPAMKPPSGWG
jgi:hypothetical protein